MAKKALISKIEPRGQNNSGYRVAEVVESGNEFEIHANFEWKDCPDNVEQDVHWFDPNSNTYRKLPDTSILPNEELSVDEQGNLTEHWAWNWDNESWYKNPIT